MVGYDLDQADKVWVREFDAESGNPGKLICVAIYMGNAVRYIPLKAERKAVEDRNRVAIRRLDEHRRAKEVELDAPYMIEQSAEQLADFIAMSAAPGAELELIRLVDADSAASVQHAHRRQVFATDAELTAWVLDHPTDLSPNQITGIRRCLSNSSSEVLRLTGIGTEALQTLLRAAA